MFTRFFSKKAVTAKIDKVDDKAPDPLEASIDTPTAAGFLKPQSPQVLLATPRRQKLLTHIWQRTSVSRTQFASMYLKPIERYAALVQQLPASESHHHAYPGGMLDHGLEIVAYALKLRQSHLLPVGTSPEAQAAQAEAWTAGVAYAALLHDIGKVAVDLHIEYEDGHIWHPWHGSLMQPYRFRYRKDREYRLHSAATGLLYHQILDTPIMDWLSGYPDLWSALLYVLSGQQEHAGVLGEIVTKADQASVAQEMGGDPARALAAPKHALQRKLLDGLRYLLKESLKLSQQQASDGWLTGDALWLVSKTVADKLRAHLLSQGISGIPERNIAVFDVLQEHGIAQQTPAGKAIWNATIKSASGWSYSFTLLKVSPALIWEAGERPQSFAGTVEVDADDDKADAGTPDGQNATASTDTTFTKKSVSVCAPQNAVPVKADSLDAVLDLLGVSTETEAQRGNEATPQPTVLNVQTPLAAPAQKAVQHPQVYRYLLPDAPTGNEVSPSGEHFMLWLRQSILGHKLIMNDAKAMVHTVADTLYLVTPSIFMRYAQEHPAVTRLAREGKLPDWHWVQKQFEQLRLHKKQPNGLNIWVCIVTGPRKTRQVNGYLLINPKLIMSDIAFNNPYLKLASEKMDSAGT